MTARGRRGILWFLAGGALALVAGRWLSGLYADWAFHHALGFDDVWRSKVLHRGALAAAALLLGGAYAFVNLFAVRQSIVSLILPRQLGNLEFGEAVPTRRLTALAGAGALAIGLFLALIPVDWAEAALAWDAVRFRELDPYLERDLGFYVAWLPWEETLHRGATLATGVVTLVVALLYASTPSVEWREHGLHISAWVRRHLAVLTGVWLLLIGWNWRLDRYALLSKGSGIFVDRASETAFAAVDHQVILGYLAAASFLTIPVAVVLVWAGWRNNQRLAFVLVSAVILGGPVTRAVLPPLGRDAASPAAHAREQPYLATAGLYTRRAYGVDEIVADSAAVARIPLRALGRQVSAWDPAALVRWQRAGGRDSTELFFAWRAGSGGLGAVLLRTPVAGLSPLADWSSVTLDPTGADAERRPVITLGDVGRAIAGAPIRPGQPQVALIPDTLGVLAVPPFEGALARLGLAWALQRPRLYLAPPPVPRPRLLLHAGVRERLRRAVPFLEAGPTVTPVVRGDSIHWIVELFSVADRYPLSEPLAFNGRERHYVRHAATAIVQGQTGRLTIVPVDVPDAVTTAWMRKFPSLFTARSDAPSWFFDERPPQLDWGLVQGRAMARVGVRGDSVGPRSLTRADDADPDLTAGPATLFDLGDGRGLAWGVPLDIPWAGRTVGLLVMRGGREARVEYHATAAPRWTTILEELQSAVDAAGIGRDLTHARRGRIQAVPTEHGPAWIQSFYDWAPDAAPRLTAVAVTINGRTRIGPSLGAALGMPDAAGRRSVPDDVFRARVSALYATMEAALRAGDWRAYGEAWAALGRLVGGPPRP